MVSAFCAAVTARARAWVSRLIVVEPGIYEINILVAPACRTGARSFSRLVARAAGRRAATDAAARRRADLRPRGRRAVTPAAASRVATRQQNSAERVGGDRARRSLDPT